MNTCRFCRTDNRGPLFKYGTRHYAHGSCGLQRLGLTFFDKIPQHDLQRFPYLAAVNAGAGAELQRRLGIDLGKI